MEYVYTLLIINYFPIQKLANMLPRISSLEILPVMEPMWYRASRMSWLRSSVEISMFRPSETLERASEAAESASKCLVLVTRVVLKGDLSDFCELISTSFNWPIPVRCLADIGIIEIVDRW